MADREDLLLDLMRRVSVGDREAYATLFRDYHAELVDRLRRAWSAGAFYGLGIDPEDIVQDFFIRLEREPGGLASAVSTAERTGRPKAAFLGWALWALRSRAGGALRSEHVRRGSAAAPKYRPIDPTDAERLVGPDPEGQYAVEEALGRLPAPERELVRLRQAGHSLDEMAESEGISVSRAYNLLRRAGAELLRTLGPAELVTVSRTAPPRPRGRLVEVFYATDRVRTRHGPDGPYGNRRSPEGRLSYGICYVNVPDQAHHKVGNIERPARWWWHSPEAPALHFILDHVIEGPGAWMFRALSAAVGGADRKEAFVFIHGYNVSFSAAAYRAAQLALDLKFSGAPILYSWASAASIQAYMQDEETVRLSVEALKGFLRDVVRRSGAATIHLIAHSMGTRAIADAFQSVSQELTADTPPAPGACRIRQIVLAAPDINVELFQGLAAAMVSQAERVTLYACAKDRALELSKRFHGYPRAGEGLTLFPGVDTIEASAVDTSFLGHGSFASNRTVLTDLGYLLNEGIPPDRRIGLNRITTDSGTYWAFQG